MVGMSLAKIVFANSARKKERFLCANIFKPLKFNYIYKKNEYFLINLKINKKYKIFCSLFGQPCASLVQEYTKIFFYFFYVYF